MKMKGKRWKCCMNEIKPGHENLDTHQETVPLGSIKLVVVGSQNPEPCTVSFPPFIQKAGTASTFPGL